MSVEVDVVAAQMCNELTACVLCRKHAHVDLVSEMDMTKALTLNGEMVLDKPIRVEKAKIKSAEKVKLSAEEKKGIDVTVVGLLHVRGNVRGLLTPDCSLLIAIKNSKCLYLKNVPFDTTKEDLLKIFKAVDVRFPGGTDGPKKG